jgi:hypothetical protein
VTNFVVQSCNGIQVLTTNLPSGMVGSYYSTQLQAASCNGGFNWSVNSGSLPPGLTLYSGGALNGTPSTNGTFNFSVQVVDSGSNSISQPLSLTIVTNIPPPSVNVAAASSGGQIVVYYPTSGSNYVLYTTTNLSTGPWVPATNGTPVISLVFSNTAPAQFYRLQ